MLTPMERYEYIRLPFNIMPEEIIEQYNLRSMEKNGHFYADTRKLMYGLPQAGRIENNFLTKTITPHGYY